MSDLLHFVELAGNSLAPWAPWGLVLAVGAGAWILSRGQTKTRGAIKSLAVKQEEMAEASKHGHEQLGRRIEQSEGYLWGAIETLRNQFIDHLASGQGKTQGD